MKKTLRVILGIDISTTCTGVSIASYDGEQVKVLYIDRVKFKQKRNVKGTDALFMKSKQFTDEFILKHKDIGITDVVIEEPLPNSQNLLTVNTLLKFNGMLSQSIYDHIGITPQYISSYDARKYAFPELMAVRKFNKNGNEYALSKIKSALKKKELVLFGDYQMDCQKKFILWNKISEMYPDIEWVYDKNDNLKTENFDASDSLVCILGYVNKEKYINNIPDIIEYNIEENIKYNDIMLTRINYTTNFCGKTFEKKIELFS